MTRRTLFSLSLLAALIAPAALAVPATVPPSRIAATVRSVEEIDRIRLPRVDRDSAWLRDDARLSRGQLARYAEPFRLAVTPRARGTWEVLGDGRRLWRLRISAQNALSLNLGFERFVLPPGGRLFVYAPDENRPMRPFTEADNERHGQLWTPPYLTDDLVIEAVLPPGSPRLLDLELTVVNQGYSGFGESGPQCGACNVDIVCTEAAGWRDQARSVGLVSIEGMYYCSGFLVNNTAGDQRPYFITAAHCGIKPENAASVVVIWNRQSATCRRRDNAVDDGNLRDFQTGAIFRAADEREDVTLVELDDPPAPSSHVYFAGWDRSTADPVVATVIHHPNSDAKRISFELDAPYTTSHLETEARGDGTHIRVVDWDIGTTEGGSSGAPLFNQDGRAVGQLHGGYAACDNDRSDWFGRLSAAWDGLNPAVRLRDWLDPLATGALILDGRDASPTR